MIVVADTSVLLNLAFLGLEGLLAALFGEVIIPAEVEREFLRMASSTGRFGGLKLPACCRIQPIGAIPSSLSSDSRLDLGEAQAIALALEEKATAILLDEINGREAAKRLGFTVIGTLGLLITAKHRGLIAEIAPLLRRLIVDASFRIGADLLREALRTAGELP